MQVRAFRGLMLSALVLTVITEIVSTTSEPWWSLSSQPNLGQGAIFAMVFTAAFGLVALAGFIGMYTLKSWGRTLALAMTLTLFLMWAVVVSFVDQAGTTSQLGLFLVLDDIAAMCWGGALSLAYFSPLAARFGANNSFKPKPLRSSNNMA